MQASSFHSAFTALARQGHVTFVAESQPLKMILTPWHTPRSNLIGEPLSQIVTEVAAAYDYDVERHSSVFLLKKRYNDSADLPDVTLAECAQALDDLQAITNTLNPHLDIGQFGGDEDVANLFTSLTPEQLERMRDKSRSVPVIDGTVVSDAQIEANIKQSYELAIQSQGLPISTLTPEQRDVIRRIILVVQIELPTMAFDPKVAADAAKKDLSFCWRMNGKERSFGYEISDDPAKKESGKQFASLVVTGSSFASTILINGKPLVMPPDPVKPLALPQPVLTVKSVSLAQAIGALNTRDATISSGVGETPPKRLVDAALASKQVSLFGVENTPPAALFQSLADIYGLSILPRKDHTLLLTRHPLRIPLDFSGFPDDVRNSTPEPLLRAVIKNSARQVAGVKLQPGMTSVGLVTASPNLVNSALHELRVAAEPRIRAAQDGHVSLSSLGDRERTALAVALSVPQLESLVSTADRGVPEIVTRFDELCMKGGPEAENKRKFDLTLVLPVAGGTVPPHEVLSASGIDYTPNRTIISVGTP